MLYKKVVTNGIRILVPFPLDGDRDWKEWSDFTESDPVERDIDYVAKKVPSNLFTSGMQGWLVIVDLLESGEARAVYDPETKGSYLMRTNKCPGTFHDRVLHKKRQRPEQEMPGNDQGGLKSPKHH